VGVEGERWDEKKRVGNHEKPTPRRRKTAARRKEQQTSLVG